MKRCPECRRDYYDDTLLYCLDDGRALLEGPRSTAGAATEVLAGEAFEPETKILDALALATGETPANQISSKLPFIGLMAVLFIAIIGLGGYYYYSGFQTKRIGSIAVLPFINQSSDPDTEYLADGIPESISNTLSQSTDLKVMSRNSVSRYRGQEIDSRSVAKDLNVQAVLFGRMVQRGDGVSISVELISAEDNTKIWGQQYSLKLTDVFEVQERIAKEIADKLSLKLSGERLAKRPTDNIKAFQYYSQGRSYYARRTRADLLTTISYYEKAIAEDGNYALAYAGLADTYGALGVRGYVAPSEGRRKEEEYARKAIELDENLAEAHVSLGLPNVVFVPFNFTAGDREMRRAIELSPSLAAAHQYLGHSLSAQGRYDEALAEYSKARELDPLSSIIARNVATAYFLKREDARALDLLRQANELGPPFTSPLEIDVYIQNDRLDETLVELEIAMRERPDDPLLIYDTGMIYAAQGKRTEALQVIRQLERMSGSNFGQAQFIARIYAVLDEKDDAIEWLERGLAAGAIGGIGPEMPVWNSVRVDPRFADLLRRMGYPTQHVGK